MSNKSAKYIATALLATAVAGVVLGGAISGGVRYSQQLAVSGQQSIVSNQQLAVSGQRADTLVDEELITDIPAVDTLPTTATVRRDTVVKKNNFLDDIIDGQNTDSLIYDVRSHLVYIYGQGDIHYQSMEMKADYMRVSMDSRELFARGVADSLGKRTKPEFIDGGTSYTMDSINYNIASGKAKIHGVASQQGEGYLIGDHVKKMADNSIHLEGGKYTTCDRVDHPHFYLSLTKGKVIPNEKVIVGYSYLVFEDVPIYFPGIPEAFFPINLERTSGFLMPTWGEEYVKGFYLRDGGWYFVLSEHADLTLRAGIYTLGSWEASVGSNYTKRYKYRGSLEARYSRDIVGEQGDRDYYNANNFAIRWTHSQDPKANPGQTFSASVNFSTSGYNRNSSTTLNDYLNTATNSSVSYSRTWAGTPFSLSASANIAQNSQSKTYDLGLPTISFNMSKIFPFKRREGVGKERWYEKISMSYTGSLTNSTRYQEDLWLRDKFGNIIGDSIRYGLTDQLIDNLRNGIKHSIPVSVPLNLFGYINISPSFNYNERWYFQRTLQEWDSDLRRLVSATPEWGFWRVYDYNVSVSASTKVYGDYKFRSPTSWLQAVRHTITPTIGASYQPDFSAPSFGFYRTVQTDSLGNTRLYSPYNGVYGGPSSGQTGALNFSLSQQIEAKILSDADTSGVRKISIIDNLSFSGSYNFLAKEFKLSLINVGLRLKLGTGSGLNLSGTFDPYRVDKRTGARINELYGFGGGLARLISTSWSYGKTWSGGKEGGAPNEQPMVVPGAYTDPFLFDPDHPIDPITRRTMMAGTYYNFAVPWSFGLNYTVSYYNSGIKPQINQTLGFNGNLNLTQRFGIQFSGGFDFTTMQITPGTISITTDLHCWQMSFNWVPIGYRRSWSFSIHVKSAMLHDLKYEKSSSMYDNIFDQ